LLTPFIVDDLTARALIITSTVSKEATTVSIGGEPATALNGGSWINHPKGMSFYNMPLNAPSASYLFANNDGIIVLSYATDWMSLITFPLILP